jgi:hypothetical protein
LTPRLLTIFVPQKLNENRPVRERVCDAGLAIIEEETPRAPAGLLEAALSVLLQATKPQATRTPEVSDSIRTVRQLRPALVAA